MHEPVLMPAERDKLREIAIIHGRTEARTLRKIYGPNFAKGFPDSAHLYEMLDHLNDHELWEIDHHYREGTLARRITHASRRPEADPRNVANYFQRWFELPRADGRRAHR